MDWDARTVTGRREWAEGLWTLTLSGAPPAFRAGQFLNLGLDLDEGLVQRSYSMASRPGEPLEFFLVRVCGGALTPQLERLRPGDTVRCSRQPAGYFTLERVPDAETLWLLATGAGLGPFLSILRSDEPWERFKQVILVHGVRLGAHLAYGEELQALSAAHGGALRVLPLVSREQPPEGGLPGRITERLADGSLEQAAGRTISNRLDGDQVLLCGNPGMLREVTDLLKGRGLAKNRRRQPGQLTTEAYWQLPR